MKYLITSIAIYISIITSLFAGEVELKSADGTTLYGDYYAGDENAPLIILNHQAGWSARGEYSEIAEKLIAEGYNILAVDARGGASREGDHPNRTIDALGGNRLPYCEVLPDVISSLKFAVEKYPDNKKILWGSSYSAALVLNVAVSEKENVAAVLAFSPASGSPMGDCQPNEHAENLTVPTMILRPASEMERESTNAQFELFKAAGHTMHIAQNGVHGSSMLVEERTGQNTDAEWTAVLSFLRKVTN